MVKIERKKNIKMLLIMTIYFRKTGCPYNLRHDPSTPHSSDIVVINYLTWINFRVDKILRFREFFGFLRKLINTKFLRSAYLRKLIHAK